MGYVFWAQLLLSWFKRETSKLMLSNQKLYNKTNQQIKQLFFSNKKCTKYYNIFNKYAYIKYAYISIHHYWMKMFLKTNNLSPTLHPNFSEFIPRPVDPDENRTRCPFSSSRRLLRQSVTLTTRLIRVDNWGGLKEYGWSGNCRISFFINAAKGKCFLTFFNECFLNKY